jgi:hypothetical protein
MISITFSLQGLASVPRRCCHSRYMADRRRTGLGSQESGDKTTPVRPPETIFLLSLLVGDPVLGQRNKIYLAKWVMVLRKLEAYLNWRPCTVVLLHARRDDPGKLNTA